MADARSELIFLFMNDRWQEKSLEIDSIVTSGGRVQVRFRSSTGPRKPYGFNPENVWRSGSPEVLALSPGTRAEIDGVVQSELLSAARFAGPEGPMLHVVTRERPEHGVTVPESQVRLLADGGATPQASSVLGYWRDIVARFPVADPIQRPFAGLRFIHPDSALACLLNGASPGSRPAALPGARIYPFRSNTSQRAAIEDALSCRVSVIDGPPGTGKTETILNIIANLVASGDRTVALVSQNNAAVRNVQEKLAERGLDFIAASLGNRENKDAFFAAAADRRRALAAFLDDAEIGPAPEDLASAARQVADLQIRARELAEVRRDLAAYELEREHFRQFLERNGSSETAELPPFRGSSADVMRFLTEPEVLARLGLVRRAAHRIVSYFTLRSLRDLDPTDFDVLLRAQRLYYDRKVDELSAQVATLEAQLDGAGLADLETRYADLSSALFRARLRERYAGTLGVQFTADSYRRARTFESFLRQFPVVLSTCHSIRGSLAPDTLLDYVIIDEASQVDLITASLALSCARNVVIVGDDKQLPHIVNSAIDPDCAPRSPHPAFDYVKHSILTSVIALYGDQLPRTMLREHYRCDPEIIEFCNRQFYDGQLIPFPTGEPVEHPLMVWATQRGGHGRWHRDGGRSNQREVDVIRDEIIPAWCADVDPSKIGTATPYRRQVSRLAADLAEEIEADTVHRYQGRAKDVMILTTVLNDTDGGGPLRFVDDPRLVNVAISRAKRRFIVVTNHARMPKSRNLRDLIDYIGYHRPAEVRQSEIVSIFDLLYRDHARTLDPLAERVGNESRYPSENIALAAIRGLLAEDRYAGIAVHSQVHLATLVPDHAVLDPEQRAYVRHRASVDFVISRAVSNRVELAIEVDGFRYHEDNPRQLERDELKNSILAKVRVPLLRLPTNGSGEIARIRAALDELLAGDELDVVSAGP